MFRVVNSEGQQIAAYVNRSELQTFLESSYPGWQKNTFDVTDDHNFSISDSKGKHLATVTGPKEAKKRPGQDDEPPIE